MPYALIFLIAMLVFALLGVSRRVASALTFDPIACAIACLAVFLLVTQGMVG